MQDQQVTGKDTGASKNAPLAASRATMQEIAQQREMVCSGVIDAIKGHTITTHALGYVV